MKNIVLPVGAVIMVAAVCGGFLSTIGSKDSKEKEQPYNINSFRSASMYPELTTNGVNLFVNEHEAMTVGKKAMANLGLGSFGVRNKEDSDVFWLTLNGKRIEHEAHKIKNILWCEARRSFFFIQSNVDPKKPKVRNDYIWQWDEAKGFRSISSSKNEMTDLTISPDSKVVLVRVGSDDGNVFSYSEDFLLVSLEGKAERMINYDDQSSGCMPLSMNEVLIDGHNTYGNQTYRWKLGDHEVTPLMQDGSMVSVTCLGGKVYGVHKRGKEFEIVEFKTKLDGWVAAYSMPKGYKKNDSTSD